MIAIDAARRCIDEAPHLVALPAGGGQHVQETGYHDQTALVPMRSARLTRLQAKRRLM